MGELVITLQDGTKQVGTTSGWGLSFADRTDIVAAVIGDGVTHIGYNAFTGCSSLAKVTLPAGLKRICMSAFEGCSSLASVKIPAGVTEIEASAFQGCSSLQSLSIGHGVRTIGRRAFKECTSLRVLELPDGVMTIESKAFEACTSIKTLKIGNVGFGKIQYINGMSFAGCTSLERVVTESYTTVFQKFGFANCPALTSARIGEQCFIQIDRDDTGSLLLNGWGGMYFDPFELHRHYRVPAYRLLFSECPESLEVKAKRPKHPNKEYTAVVKYRDWVSLLGNNRKSKLSKPLPGLSGPMLTTILDHQAAAERRSMFLHKTVRYGR